MDDMEFLQELEALFIEHTLRQAEITEGIVAAQGERPYRRLDCDGRTLVYVHRRPRWRALRIEFTALWQLPHRPPHGVRSSSGLTSLMVRHFTDVVPAAEFVWATVANTRRAWRAPVRRIWLGGLPVDPRGVQRLR